MRNSKQRLALLVAACGLASAALPARAVGIADERGEPSA